MSLAPRLPTLATFDGLDSPESYLTLGSSVGWERHHELMFPE